MSQTLPPTLELVPAAGGYTLRLLDQTLLPNQETVLELVTVPQVCEAIRRLRVRGAPAIGCAAACGLAVAASRSQATSLAALQEELRQAISELAATRPTAVNLFWALERMRALVETADGATELVRALVSEAEAIVTDDVDRCRRMGQHGAALIPAGARLLTHCNAGALATAGYGTALGVIRAAYEQGKVAQVWVDETRPLLQGARLTAYELQREGIPCTVICDSMAASLMARGEIDCAVVGADRIAANGDVANKIGTYSVAVACRHHGLPFYVAAPLSTVDYELQDGAAIPIEQREAAEITHLAYLSQKAVVPDGVAVHNPAFDVTPASLVTAIVTEAGVVRPPYAPALAGVRPQQAGARG